MSAARASLEYALFNSLGTPDCLGVRCLVDNCLTSREGLDIEPRKPSGRRIVFRDSGEREKNRGQVIYG